MADETETGPTLRDPELKRQEFAKALFDTLAPAVRQCDEVVRGVFHSQNKVLTEIANLEQSMCVTWQSYKCRLCGDCAMMDT